MNNTPLRNLLAQAMIIVGICIGACFVVLKPRLDETTRLETELAEHAAATGDAAAPQSVTDAAQTMADVRARLNEIRSANELATDSSRYYGQIMDLADALGVQVQSLQPGAARQQSSESKVTITRMAMSVRGTYKNIASFLEDVCELKAFVRPISVQMQPSRSQGQDQVELSFACDLLNFAIEDVLVNVGVADNAQP